MKDSDLTLSIEGPDAERLAGELSEVLEDELDVRPRRQRPPSARGKVFRLDPVAVAALVLAIPSAVLATADLAEKAKLKQKVDRLIAWAREKAGKGTANKIEIVDAEGRARRLDEIEAAEVIEIAVIAARITRRRGR